MEYFVSGKEQQILIPTPDPLAFSSTTFSWNNSSVASFTNLEVAEEILINLMQTVLIILMMFKSGMECQAKIAL